MPNRIEYTSTFFSFAFDKVKEQNKTKKTCVYIKAQDSICFF